MDAKQQEMNENLTVLRVQVATAKEELEKLNQQAKTYKTLASLRSRVCNICPETGHNASCCDIDSCKIKDRHPEHKTKINEIQREFKALESQVQEEEGNIQSLSSARERANT